ncbi:MAG: hypothetical protein K2Q26_01695 [Bdellovibrionales bacterium]|nr:hypothetical protein [Bdellovibrionales bacterium]
MSFLAPQAYTKETLGKAFDWLQHQPQSVKEVASTPDILVNMYLRAQRQGINTIDADAPNSAKKFMEELTSLKKDIAQFDDGPQNLQTSVQNSRHQSPHIPLPPIPTSVPKGHGSAHFASQNSATNFTQKTTINTAQSITMESTSSHIGLDETTQRLVQDIQERFNLSSPQEALRMMVSVAHKKITSWE